MEHVLLERPVGFLQSLYLMNRQVQYLRTNPSQPGIVWFLEYNSVYTVGSGYDYAPDILRSLPAPLIFTNRGGKVTYHGLGQLVVYVFCNLNTVSPLVNKQKDILAYIRNLEHWIIRFLNIFGISGRLMDGHSGVYVEYLGNLYKIASIGLRCSSWISYFGFSVNLCTDLNFFKAIRPCGTSILPINLINLTPKLSSLQLSPSSFDMVFFSNLFMQCL